MKLEIEFFTCVAIPALDPASIPPFLSRSRIATITSERNFIFFLRFTFRLVYYLYREHLVEEYPIPWKWLCIENQIKILITILKKYLPCTSSATEKDALLLINQSNHCGVVSIIGSSCYWNPCSLRSVAIKTIDKFGTLCCRIISSNCNDSNFCSWSSLHQTLIIVF